MRMKDGGSTIEVNGRRYGWPSEPVVVVCIDGSEPGYDGIDCALDRAEGCRRFELPEDRVGDVIVTATRHKVLGTRPERHDLTGLTEPLRSHGSLFEQRVPLLLNRPTPTLEPGRRLRNFDIFDVALNHAEAGSGHA